MVFSMPRIKSLNLNEISSVRASDPTTIDLTLVVSSMMEGENLEKASARREESTSMKFFSLKSRCWGFD